ncbi:hypothetical protein [Thermogutta sp.]|uniref:hypothetical protein n=1 Tax=Thermogutta sp. TaxID=1962930 RepID=UPI00322021B0
MTVISLDKEYLNGPVSNAMQGKITRIESGRGDFGPIIRVTILHLDTSETTLVFPASSARNSKWGHFISSLLQVLGVSSEELKEALENTWLEFGRQTITFGRGDDARTVDVWVPTRVLSEEETALLPEDEIILAFWPGVVTSIDQLLVAVAAAGPEYQPVIDYIATAGEERLFAKLASLGAIRESENGWVPTGKFQVK